MDSFISQIPNRISKLDCFLRQNEEKIGSRNLRYYESCVVDSKGTLLLGHLILTDESLFLTQNPPKSFSHEIPFGSIKSIHLVADRKPLVKGPANNNTYPGQHVQVLYSCLKADKEDEASKNSNEKWNSTKDNRDGHKEILSELSQDSLKICHCYKDLPEIPLIIHSAYHPHFCRRSTSSEKSSISSSEVNSVDLPRKFQSTSNSNENDTGIESGNSSPTGSQIPNSDPPVRASSVLEQKLFSWRSRKDNLTREQPERPSSIDISQLPTLRKNYLQRIVSRTFLRHEENASPTAATLPRLPNTEKPKQFQEVGIYLYESNSIFLNEAFLYWNRHILKSALAIEEKFSFATYGELDRGLHAAENEFSRLGCDRNGELTIVWNSNSQHTILELNRVFTRLTALHASLLRYHHLCRLCWKSSALIRSLLRILKSCIIPVKSEGKENHLGSKEKDRILVLQLSMYLLIINMFRIFFESCSTSSTIRPQKHEGQINKTSIDTLEGETLEWSQITKILCHNVFSFPTQSMKRKLIPSKILNVILQPQTFAKLECIRHKRKSKIIALLAMGHNASAALLYEILSVINFSRRDLGRMSITKYLENYKMEMYLKMSVTQIVHLLWPTYCQLTASHCILLHIHVTVLNLLLNNIPTVKEFLQLTFAEEFRYFITSKSAANKIAEECPVKENLLQAFDKLRNVITS